LRETRTESDCCIANLKCQFQRREPQASKQPTRSPVTTLPSVRQVSEKRPPSVIKHTVPSSLASM
jgi:hypothetical protein